MPVTTIIDVIDDCLGGTDPEVAKGLTTSLLDELAGRVVEFYDSWRPRSSVESGPLTTYSGANLGIHRNEKPALEGLFASLLYYPAVTVHCPFADWFNRDLERLRFDEYALRKTEVVPVLTEFRLAHNYFTEPAGLEESRERLRLTLVGMHALRALIQRGTVIPVPAWKIVADRQLAIGAALRHDIRDSGIVEALSSRDPGLLPRISDFLSAGAADFRGVPRRYVNRVRVEPAAFYLNKMITVADVTSSVYVPPGEADYTLLGLRARRLRAELRRSRLDFDIVSNVLEVDLPIFSDLSVDVVASMRDSEREFAEFRDALSSAFRAAKSYSTGADAISELREGVRAELAPRVEDVRRATSRSAALKLHLEAGVTAITVDGVALGALALAGGSAMTVPSVASVLAGGGIAAALVRVFRGRAGGVQGSNLVIAKMLSARTVNS